MLLDMPNVSRENLDDLNAVLTITIPRQDIEPKLKSELQKFRKKANLKGFRKGKVPVGFVKKMYGQSIMVNVVNEAIEKELSDYITNEKVEILGQPMPSADQDMMELHIDKKEDLTFKFDLGLAPKFDVQGIEASTTMEKFAVKVPAQMIDDDLLAGRKRLGERKSADDEVQEGDMITLNAVEMDGDKVKKDGWATTFSVLYNDVPAGATKDELSTLKNGDKFIFDIFQIEGDKSPEHVRQHLLNVQENDGDPEIGSEFEGTITNIGRQEPAELNQEFFDKYFGPGKATNEEEARGLIETDIVKYYDQQAEGLLFRDLQEMLLEKNPVTLPDNFLKRWLITSSEQNTPEIIEKGYEGFAKNLQWTLIRSKLAEKYKVEVSNEEVLGQLRSMIMRYYGAYMDEGMLNSMVQRMAQEREQYEKAYEDLLVDKIFKAVKEDIKVTEKKISKEDFEKMMEEARAKVAAAQMAQELPQNSDEEE